MGGYLHYKTDRTSLWLEGNLCAIVLFLFCFILHLRVISNYKPQTYRKRPCISRTFFHKTEAKNRGCGYIRMDILTKGFLCYEFEGYIFGGAYMWRGLFWNFIAQQNYNIYGQHFTVIH